MCNLSMGIYEKGISAGILQGRQEGRQEGLQEGRQKGLQEGKQKGLQEGKIQNAIEVVKSLLEENFTLDDALRLAHIDKETYIEYRDAN